MKAIILAAGLGTRLGSYTKKMPKGMLSVGKKTLIQRQLETFRSSGITDICVVTGYQRDKITYPDVRYYNNPHFATTNMVETLLCARKELDSDIIVSYSDLIFEQSLVHKIMQNQFQVAVAVDDNWRDYWKIRYNSVETDIESLVVSEKNKIIEIGKPLKSSLGLQYRYIGLLKFSRKAILAALHCYDQKKDHMSNWPLSGQPFKQGYMTDLLQSLIETGTEVRPVITSKGWLEFDTVRDYEIITQMFNNGTIKQLINL